VGLGDVYKRQVVVVVHADEQHVHGGRSGAGAVGDEPTPEDTEHLLRIVGEAVRNAARHGRARTVLVTLRSDTTDDRVTHQLTVTDDGAGFDPSSPPPWGGGGYGLTSMRDRATAIGGTLAVESETGVGTTVTVVW